MEATYELDGELVTLTRIDLTMDGFESVLTGEVDLLNWPEQTYQIVESDIELPPMKDIFFAQDEFTVTGGRRVHRHVAHIRWWAGAHWVV